MSCVVGSLWLATLAAAITALAATFLKPVLALSAGPDLLAPLLVGLIAAVATEAFKFARAYWTVVHDSLEHGLSAEEKLESGFNGTHTRLTDSKPKERRVALKAILDAKSPQKTSEPADPTAPKSAASSGVGPALKASAAQDKPTNTPPAATPPQQPRRADGRPNDGDPPVR